MKRPVTIPPTPAGSPGHSQRRRRRRKEGRREEGVE
jgi:hypothetical protein